MGEFETLYNGKSNVNKNKNSIMSKKLQNKNETKVALQVFCEPVNLICCAIVD